MLYKQLQFTTGWFGRLMFKFDSKIDIRFDDVIGYDAQKIKLRQAISKILNNQESKPKGIIIKGPEGTRKTFMAKVFRTSHGYRPFRPQKRPHKCPL